MTIDYQLAIFNIDIDTALLWHSALAMLGLATPSRLIAIKVLIILITVKNIELFRMRRS